jgi:hypothetical protein
MRFFRNVKARNRTVWSRPFPATVCIHNAASQRISGQYGGKIAGSGGGAYEERVGKAGLLRCHLVELLVCRIARSLVGGMC